MGEYAERKNDGQRIKIGTCESMYYLRFEDQDKVRPDDSSGFGYFWRLPFPDEDDILPGNYQGHLKGYRLFKQDGFYPLASDYPSYVDFSDPETITDPGNMQLIHKESGLLVNIKCYHGEQLPKGSEDFKPSWNGKSHALELSSIRSTSEGLFPVVSCRFCGKMWRYDWAEILPYVQDKELKSRLTAYSFGSHHCNK